MTADMPHSPTARTDVQPYTGEEGKGARGSYQLVRNRIVVDINAHKRYAVKMRKDVSAVPQTVVYIQAQSAEQLRHRLDGGKLRSLTHRSYGILPPSCHRIPTDRRR